MKLFKIRYEDENKPDDTNKTPPADKSFTQEQVNALIAKEKDQIKRRYEKTIADLESFKQTASLTQTQVDDLNAQIDTLKRESMTKEELSREESARKEAEYKGKLTKTEQERDSWRDRFTTSTIERSIIDSALGAKAYNPEQIVALLKPAARLDEVVEGTKKTGKYVTKIRFNTVDADGKPTELDLAPEDAIKKMTEDKRFMNLFVSEAKGGLGGFNFNTPPQQKGPITDTSKYIENRNKMKGRK